MPQDIHQNIRRIRYGLDVIEGKRVRVAYIDTDLHLDHSHPDCNVETIDDLITHAEAYLRLKLNAPITIRLVSIRHDQF